MKYSTYIIAGLLIVLWGVVVYGFNYAPKIVHVLIPLAGVIILLRIFYRKEPKLK